ncbi:MAG TPA: hypothetical protein VMQ62_08390, partial [Dongiaceae bacterium]|nr:hypothetical protein [Dongiaceae bacterium]
GHRLQALEPRGEAWLWARALLACAAGDAAALDGIVEELRHSTDATAYWTVRSVGGCLADFEGALRLTGALTDPARSVEARLLGFVAVAHLEAARGRRAAAESALESLARLDPDQALVQRALFAAWPVAPAGAAALRSLVGELQRWRPAPPRAAPEPVARLLPRADLHGLHREYLLGLLAARLGEMDQVRARADALRAAPAPDDVAVLARELADGLVARVDWEAGRRDRALEALLDARRPVRFDLEPPSPLYAQCDERWALAQWLEATGRPEEAIPWYASFLRGAVFDLPYTAPALLARARLQEKTGCREGAGLAVARFLAARRAADAEFAPAAAEGRALFARLSDSTPTR